MAITGRTAKSCFDTFRNHIAGVVAKILPGNPHLLNRFFEEDEGRCVLTFAGDGLVPLKSANGLVYLFLQQHLEARIPEGKAQYRLSTKRYQYKLYAGTGTRADALLRWEYDWRPREHDGPCRHHFQVGRIDRSAVTLPLSDGELNLNKVHLPTAFVLMEEVFRFLIHELKVSPPCGDSWPQVLAASEKSFYENFTTPSREPRSE